MSEDNDFDMCQKPSTMPWEIEALRHSIKSFFTTDVLFEELGWEAVFLFSWETSQLWLQSSVKISG